MPSDEPIVRVEWECHRCNAFSEAEVDISEEIAAAAAREGERIMAVLPVTLNIAWVGDTATYVRAIIDTLQAAAARARREALEEAIKLVGDYCTCTRALGECPACGAEADIRALASDEASDGEKGGG